MASTSSGQLSSKILSIIKEYWLYILIGLLILDTKKWGSLQTYVLIFTLLFLIRKVFKNSTNENLRKISKYSGWLILISVCMLIALFIVGSSGDLLGH